MSTPILTDRVGASMYRAKWTIPMKDMVILDLTLAQQIAELREILKLFERLPSHGTGIPARNARRRMECLRATIETLQDIDDLRREHGRS